jgi:hypothetical protein
MIPDSESRGAVLMAAQKLQISLDFQCENNGKGCIALACMIGMVIFQGTLNLYHLILEE